MLSPLDIIARLRRQAVDEAAANLVAHLGREDVAALAIGVATAALAEEREAATSLAAGDLAVEAFAAWLPQGRRALEAARAAHHRASAATAQARAGLAAARAAAEAVQGQLDRLAAEQRAQLLRAEQAELDEAAARMAGQPAADGLTIAG